MTLLPAEFSHKERAVLSNGSTHRKHCSFIVPLCSTNANLSGRGPSICSRRPFGHLKAPLGFHCFANANFTYLDNGNVNFPDNKKYSRSKPTIIRIPPTTLMPIRLTLLFFYNFICKNPIVAHQLLYKNRYYGYMSFLLSNSDLLNQAEYITLFPQILPHKKTPMLTSEDAVHGSFCCAVTAYCYLLKVSSFSRPSLLATQMLATASPTTFREVTSISMGRLMARIRE